MGDCFILDIHGKEWSVKVKMKTRKRLCVDIVVSSSSTCVQAIRVRVVSCKHGGWWGDITRGGTGSRGRHNRQQRTKATAHPKTKLREAMRGEVVNNNMLSYLTIFLNFLSQSS